MGCSARVSGVSAADGLTTDDHLYASVLLATCCRAICRDWIFLSIAFGDDRVRRNALLQQVAPHRVSTPLREIAIVVSSPGGIGVTIDADSQIGISEQNPRDLRELFSSARLQRRLIYIEQYIRHVDDQAFGAIPGLQHLVQLHLKALTEISFALLRCSCLLLRALCLLLRLLRLLLRLRQLLFGLLTIGEGLLFRSFRFLSLLLCLPLQICSLLSRLLGLLLSVLSLLLGGLCLLFRQLALRRFLLRLRLSLSGLFVGLALSIAGLLFMLTLQREQSCIFRRLHRLASFRNHDVFVVPSILIGLCLVELILRVAIILSGIAVSLRPACDSDRVASLEKFQRNMALARK